MRMEFEPTGDGRIVAIVQDGDETHLAFGATKAQATFEMRKFLQQLKKIRGVCGLCGASRNKCCC